MNRHRLSLLAARAETLASSVTSLKTSCHAMILSKNIEDAVRFCKGENPKKPLVISLVGGTGVGKSFVFSAVGGIENLSPSSSSVRGFTKKPYVAVDELNRGFVRFNPEEVVFVPAIQENTIYIDAPDLDTINGENARLAHETIAVSDIIILVTTPDKRSDFSVHQSLLEWGSRKRWFFVMNKVDLVADVSTEALRADFEKKLRRIGFVPDRGAIFLFSAKDKTSGEFQRFKNSVKASHPGTLSRLLHEEACIRQLEFAISSDSCINSLNSSLVDLKNSRDTLANTLALHERAVLNSEPISRVARESLLQEIYATIGTTGTLFLFPYFYFLRRFRLAAGRGRVERSVKVLFMESDEIRSCFVDETRLLQDHHLPFESPEANHEKYCTRVKDEIASQIDDSARKAATARRLKFYLLIGNLLPLTILVQALYRSVTTWISGVWLPSDFFVHAVFLIVGSSVPGFFLVSKAVHHVSTGASLCETRNSSRHFSQLNSSVEQLESLLHQASVLSSECNETLEEISRLLPSTSFGLTQSRAVNEAGDGKGTACRVPTEL